MDMIDGKESKRFTAVNSKIWEIRFSDDGRFLLCLAEQLVYALDWENDQWSLLADLRYDERLEGCDLRRARFADGLSEADIRLLKSYS